MDKMDKTTFCSELATCEAISIGIRELSESLEDVELDYTWEGAINQYKQYFPNSPADCAHAWVREHFDTIAAQVNALRLLADLLTEKMEPLWSNANALIPEDKSRYQKEEKTNAD